MLNKDMKSDSTERSKRVLFIHLSQDFGSLAIEYLSASLKKNGHQVDLIIHYGQEKYFIQRLYKKLKEFKPDFVCFSVTTFDCQWAFKMSKVVKEIINTKIVFGGIHPTSLPEETIKNPYVDYIVLGEGDETIVDLVENPDKADIKNVWLKKNGKIIRNRLRPLLENLDELPYPDKDLFYEIAPYMKYTYLCIGGKGCPFHCSYCFNNCLKKIYKGERWVRKRSVDNLINELKIMKKKSDYKQIFFYDDCFTSDLGWLKEFTKKYKQEINLPFRSLSHPMFLDKERINLLKEAGCIKIQVGAQTPIEKIRKEICKRQDSNERIMNAVETIKRAKMVVSVDHIFGLPSEKIEEYYTKGLDFYIDLKPNMYFTFWLQYYPSTEILDIGKEYGLIDNKEISRINKGYVSYGNQEISKETIPIATFMDCIPYLPKKVSRFILKKRLISKLFRFKSINIMIHLASISLPHFYSPKLFNALIMEIKKVTGRRQIYLKQNRIGKRIKIPKELELRNHFIRFMPFSNYKAEVASGEGMLNRE